MTTDPVPNFGELGELATALVETETLQVHRLSVVSRGPHGPREVRKRDVERMPRLGQISVDLFELVALARRNSSASGSHRIPRLSPIFSKASMRADSTRGSSAASSFPSQSYQRQCSSELVTTPWTCCSVREHGG
jgi:hypothetical protein